jgi:hypothetical protein
VALPASSPLKRLLDVTDVASAARIHETLDAALGE